MVYVFLYSYEDVSPNFFLDGASLIIIRFEGLDKKLHTTIFCWM